MWPIHTISFRSQGSCSPVIDRKTSREKTHIPLSLFFDRWGSLYSLSVKRLVRWVETLHKIPFLVCALCCQKAFPVWNRAINISIPQNHTHNPLFTTNTLSVTVVSLPNYVSPVPWCTLIYYSLVSIKIIKPELYTATSQQHHITAASLGELSIRIIIQACFYKIILSKGTKIVRLNARVQKYNLTAENYTVT